MYIYVNGVAHVSFLQVYRLMYDMADHSEPITGLQLVPFPSQSSTSEIKYFILATTPKRIYQFIGTVMKGETPQFVQLFATYDTVTVQFLEIPGNLKESQLQLWPARPDTTPRAFAWLTGETCGRESSCCTISVVLQVSAVTTVCSTYSIDTVI